jgi:hypothetical protein
MKTEQAWTGQYRVELLVVIMGSTALVGIQSVVASTCTPQGRSSVCEAVVVVSELDAFYVSNGGLYSCEISPARLGVPRLC